MATVWRSRGDRVVGHAKCHARRPCHAVCTAWRGAAGPDGASAGRAVRRRAAARDDRARARERARGTRPALQSPPRAGQCHPLRASATLRAPRDSRSWSAFPPTSAPGLGSPNPHLRRDWAQPPCHICTRTGLTPPASATGLGSPPRHLHQDWGHPCPHLHRDWGHPTHICTRTGLTPLVTSAPGLGSPLTTSAPRLGSPMPTSAPGLGSALHTSAPGLGSPCPHLHRDPRIVPVAVSTAYPGTVL
jgi:hypothetical protein